MVRIQVDIDHFAVARFLEIVPETVNAEAAKAMEISTFIVEAEVKALTPRKTGRLFSSWGSNVRLAPGLTGIVSTNVSYAPYVEEGTGPHDIWAKPGSALFWPGALHPVKRVYNPGFVGRHMARLAAAIARPAIFGEFRRAIKHAVDAALALGKL